MEKLQGLMHGITYEHLKYGGETMVRELLKFYNCIIEREEIPDSLKLAVKISLFSKATRKRTRLMTIAESAYCLPLAMYWSVLYTITFTKTAKVSPSSLTGWLSKTTGCTHVLFRNR